MAQEAGACVCACACVRIFYGLLDLTFHSVLCCSLHVLMPTVASARTFKTRTHPLAAAIIIIRAPVTVPATATAPRRMSCSPRPRQASLPHTWRYRCRWTQRGTGRWQWRLRLQVPAGRQKHYQVRNPCVCDTYVLHQRKHIYTYV